ncbi:ABC transporter permease [Paenibacillus ferrarius]|uniref:ABC transporter permease n=1 Tax=Paenibacillus ferrarius TaxID=1469647 RepID=UPI0009A519DF|nr:ABC transporter permease [Paenibacillus ferrarius]
MKEVLLKKDQSPLSSRSTVESAPLGTLSNSGFIRSTTLFEIISKSFPFLFGLFFIFVWQFHGYHFLFRLERYQLPIPSDIVRSISDNGEILLIYTLYTGIEIVGGFLIGSLLGWLAAVAASYRPQAGAGGITILASMNAIPIVALAPIMNNWLGDGVASRIGIVSVMTMATMAVSTYKGLQSIESTYLELMTSYAASKGQIFLKLRLPKALPAIFSALKINMSTSIIGAIVGEFFIASRGLGYLLSDQIRLANMPLAWACIVIAAIAGIFLYTIIQLLERTCMPWSVTRR